MAARQKVSRTLAYCLIVSTLIFFTLNRMRREKLSPRLQEAMASIDSDMWSSSDAASSPPQHQPHPPEFNFLSQSDDAPFDAALPQDETPTPSSDASLDVEVETKHLPSFYDVAMDKGSNKVMMHSYQGTYERHLPARARGRKIKLLEIGLGCDAGYGPGGGAAYNTWREYYPGVDLYFIESDAECAERYREEMSGATVVVGDAGDRDFLDEFLQVQGASGGGNFDVIVAGGGTSVAQQIAGLETLWKGVRPGGVYFCEFLETSYMHRYGSANATSGKKGEKEDKESMVRFLQDLIADMMYPDASMEADYLKDDDGIAVWQRKVKFDEVESVRHVDCSKQICAISKRAD